MEKGMYQLPHSIDTAGPAQQLSVFSNFIQAWIANRTMVQENKRIYLTFLLCAVILTLFSTHHKVCPPPNCVKLQALHRRRRGGGRITDCGHLLHSVKPGENANNMPSTQSAKFMQGMKMQDTDWWWQAVEASHPTWLRIFWNILRQRRNGESS